MSTFTAIDFNPFDGQEIQKVCFTNESQKEIWLSCILGGETASLAYNQSFSLYFKGKLNIPALKKSITAIISRHEALRSNFSSNGEKNIVYENSLIDLTFHDISYLDKDQIEKTLKEYIHQEMNTVFNLENGPLLRTSLYQLDSEANILTLSVHHIIADGWSLKVIIEDLGNFYSAYNRSQEKVEFKPPFQISNYSKELLNFKGSQDYLDNESFWLNLFKNNIPETPLPIDFLRNPDRSYQGERIDLTLPKDLHPKLKAFGIKTACSLVTLMYSSFEIYLAKKTNQEELVLGLFSAGRPEAHHYDSVGHYVNLLPLKSVIDHKLTFSEYLKKRKGEILDAIDHQQFTFGELIKKLYIPRDGSRVPLVPVVFNLDIVLGDNINFEGLTFDMIIHPRNYENFELNLNILWEKDSATLQCTYNKDLFKASTVKRILEEYTFFLQEIINKPTATIQELLIDDLQTTLATIAARNNTYSPFSKEETLLSYVDSIVEKYPAKTAISFHDKKLTFNSLAQQANQLAHILIENGVKSGDNVGIALSRSPKVIISMLAILKCGAVYIPLDPEFPHGRIIYMLENSEAKVLITSEFFKGKFQSNAKELLIEDCWDRISSYPINAPTCKVTGEGLAYILYTSGSTGKPKGVQIRHYSLLNFLLSMKNEPGMKASDKCLAITTVSFDIAALEIFLPLITGAEIVLADEATARNGAELLSIIRNQSITIMQATPVTWTMMLYEKWEDKIPLKILCGGESLPKNLANKLLKRSYEVWNMYGPTETTIWSTTKRLSLDDEIITVGRPINNTLIYILDENLNIVPEGTTGEIYIAGDGLALGYMNRADLTIDKFIDNPFDTNKSPKMYGTGDLGLALESGEIQCLGRLDHQVKIRGFRIELGEIEYALRKIELIKEVIVIAREDSPDDKRLCAYIIPTIIVDNEIENTLKVIWRQQLNEILPPYMIPNNFVLLTKFPLTPNGKIDRKQLPKPEHHVINELNTPAPSVGYLTETIAKVWAESLGTEHIKLTDDFFQLGGHSLLAVQIMTRLEQETGKKLPLTSLFKFSSFASFVNLYESESKGINTQVLSKEDNNLKGEEIIVPTTEAQKQIWLACMIGGDQANLAYNLPVYLKMDGLFNFEAFKKAFKVIIDRHESLRTNISESGESLIIHPEEDLVFEINDISMLNEQEKSTLLKEFIDREMNIPFNLYEGPLLRVFLHKLGNKTHHFILIIHHIICDGSSIDIIFDELSQLYNAYVKQQEINLSPAPQISDFALDCLTFNNSSNYHLTQNYWLKQYKDEIPMLDIPVDYPRVAKRNYRAEQSENTITNDVFFTIQRVSKQSKCSIVTTLLSAFELFLYGQTNQRELVVGLPVSGQSGPFSGLVGHCVNLLPIKSTIDVDETFIQYLKRRATQIYKDYDHQKLTYNELLKSLKLKRDATRIPLVPVMFSMRSNQDIFLEDIKHEFEDHALVAQTFEISLYIILYKNKLEFTWVYNPDLFKKETIVGFQSDFAKILEQLDTHLDSKIKDIQLSKHKKNTVVKAEIDKDSELLSKQSDYTQVKTKTEELIANIWSQHLNIQDISVTSDFFDLGGHSLIAIKIMTEIEKEIGKHLPLASLFEYSTIKKLAKKIDLDQEKQWKSIVPIKVSGDKPPLYIIHGQGMHVIGFNTLANEIDKDQPLYGIQPKGLDPNETPLENIEEIARGYVRELIKHNPSGPYLITGYSSGGTIALEMSEQLLKMGKKVSFLGIIDTFYGGESYASLIKKNKFIEVFKHAIRFVGYGFVYFTRYPKAFTRHKVNFIIGTLYNNYKKINPMKKNLSNPLYILDRLQKAHVKAYKRYVLKTYNTDITLFRANDKVMTYIPNLESNGLGPYINGKLKLIDVPLGHLQFFHPNYVGIFAKKIQEELNKSIQ